MLVNKIKKWVDNEEKWFIEFLADMTKNEKYGENLTGEYHDVEFDGEDLNLTYELYNRCGDSDYYYATIPLEDVVRKLRKDKLEQLKK